MKNPLLQLESVTEEIKFILWITWIKFIKNLYKY